MQATMSPREIVPRDGWLAARAVLLKRNTPGWATSWHGSV
jgi:hypothetical protein